MLFNYNSWEFICEMERQWLKSVEEEKDLEVLNDNSFKLSMSQF